jgi:hypothetical protein
MARAQPHRIGGRFTMRLSAEQGMAVMVEEV